MAHSLSSNKGDPLGEHIKSESGNEDVTVPALLPVPATLAKPNDSLCDTCRVLDLTPRRFVVLPGDPEDGSESDDPSIELGFVDDIRKKSHCPFCRLVLTALGPGLPSVEDGERVSIVLSWNTDGPAPDRNAPWDHTPQIRILRPYAVKNLEEKDYVSAPDLHLFPEITMVANDAPTPSKSFFIRFVKDQIDFEMVRNWLSICRINHGSQCDKSEMLDQQIEDPATEIPHFRLIDVIDNCIIPAPSGCQYVALSYVWGRIDPATILRSLKENFKQLENPGELLLPENLTRIPLTIRDAMQVVRELGMRYLWVDSLCIIQDDAGQGGSKLGSISKMDVVYGAAYLTIMAAAGIDANAGLPGLHKDTRGINQPIEQVLPDLRLGFRQRYQNYIRKAVYYTRAWTFQEQRFTKRSLVFIGGQVIYRCRDADEWREDIVFEDQKNGGNEMTDEDEDDIGQYEGSIQSYSGLSLTYDSDIYHAFAGMTRYFKTHLKVNLCHGIPDAYFDWFLLWISLAPQKRREKTPSWSWSGWIGESWPCMWSWYNRSIARISGALPQRTWIIWYQRKAHDSKECVRVWSSEGSSTSSSGLKNIYGSIQSHLPPTLSSKAESLYGSLQSHLPPTLSSRAENLYGSIQNHLPSTLSSSAKNLFGSSTQNRAPLSNFYGGEIKSRFAFDCSRTEPTRRKLAGAPEYVEDTHNPAPGSGFLQFWTVSVMFKLDKPTSVEDKSGPLNTRSRIGIFGRDGRELGSVFTNPDWAKINVPKSHEFILLCEGRDDRGVDGETDGELGWKYKVMLIEWHGEWAERISVGSIEKEDLDQALGNGPVWKEIILG